MEHLLVGLFVVEGDNGDAIVDLIGERVHAVVYDHHVFHSSVGNDSQVFDVVALRRLNAVLPVQSILEQLILRVNVVQYGISVGLVRRCEHDHLELFVGLLQTLHQVWAQIDTSTYCFFSREVNLKQDIRILRLNVINTVNECLVHVENEHFLVLWIPRIGQVNLFVLDALFSYDCQVVSDEV